MADVQIVSTAPQVYVRHSLQLVSQGANSSVIRTVCYALVRNGTRTGGWDWNTYVNGQGVSGSTSSTWGTGDWPMGYGDYSFNHDANGNLYVEGSAYLDVYYGRGTSTSGYWAPRIPLAPTHANSTADNITDITARLGNEISSFGHGTACDMRMYWKKTNMDWWYETGVQADAAGYNYWNIGDLVPNTNYNYFGRQWNNNGDSSDGDWGRSFLTKSNGTTGTPTALKSISVTIPATVALGDTGAAVPTSKLQYRKQGASTWIDTASQQAYQPSFALASLTPNTTYEYQLLVTNATGTWTSGTSTIKTKPVAGLLPLLMGVIS